MAAAKGYGRETPTETVRADGEVEFAHPAFGQISITRVSGRSYLHGADYEVSDYMSIKIATNTKRRHLSRFWFSEVDPIVEVALSPAQWATFLTSLNVGNGVPCTITRRGRDMVPGIQPEAPEEEFHRKEVDEAIVEAKTALDDLQGDIDNLKISAAARRELSSKIATAKMAIGSSQSFIRQSFGEYVQKRTERMKADLHAYAEMALMGLGLKAAKNQIESVTRAPEITDQSKDD